MQISVARNSESPMLRQLLAALRLAREINVGRGVKVEGAAASVWNVLEVTGGERERRAQDEEKEETTLQSGLTLCPL